MSDTQLSFLTQKIVIGILVTVVGGVILAYILGEGPFGRKEPPPEIQAFEMAPPEIGPGEEATLRWAVTGATEVEVEPDLGKVALSGNMRVGPAESRTYVLRAVNAGGAKSASVSLRVRQTASSGGGELAPEIKEFETQPPEIAAGEEATLRWDVIGATEVEINQGVGKVGSSGTRKVRPTKNTAYLLRAVSPAGARTATVAVNVRETAPFVGLLLFRDLFRGDSGWERIPPHPEFARVYKTHVGQDRFYMELTENRSATVSYRGRLLQPDEDFFIEVTANATEPTPFDYGLCWVLAENSAGARTEYFFHLAPGMDRPGSYSLIRDESWMETLPDGGQLRHARGVNAIAPDQQGQFESRFIHMGTEPNKLAVARVGNVVKIYINGNFVNQAPYEPAPVQKMGLFIAGQLKVEFRELSVRVRRPS